MQQSEVVLDISQSEVVNAGRYGDRLFWMVTDKAAATINYNAMQWPGIPNVPYSGGWAELDGNGDYLVRLGLLGLMLTTNLFYHMSGAPWAMGGVVRFDTSSKEGTFFGRSRGWHSNSGTSNGGIHLGVTNDDKLIFMYG